MLLLGLQITPAYEATGEAGVATFTVRVEHTRVDDEDQYHLAVLFLFFKLKIKSVAKKSETIRWWGTKSCGKNQLKNGAGSGEVFFTAQSGFFYCPGSKFFCEIERFTALAKKTAYIFFGKPQSIFFRGQRGWVNHLPKVGMLFWSRHKFIWLHCVFSHPRSFLKEKDKLHLTFPRFPCKYSEYDSLFMSKSAPVSCRGRSRDVHNRLLPRRRGLPGPPSRLHRHPGGSATPQMETRVGKIDPFSTHTNTDKHKHTCAHAHIYTHTSRPQQLSQNTRWMYLIHFCEHTMAEWKSQSHLPVGCVGNIFLLSNSFCDVVHRGPMRRGGNIFTDNFRWFWCIWETTVPWRGRSEWSISAETQNSLAKKWKVTPASRGGWLQKKSIFLDWTWSK